MHTEFAARLLADTEAWTLVESPVDPATEGSVVTLPIKDAIRTRTPGSWGEEVPVGEGQVDWRSFFPALKELNFTGDYVIEREAGSRRVADIQTARLVVERNFQS